MEIKYLIRDDGVSIIEANAHTLKLENFRPYEFPKPKEKEPEVLPEVETAVSVEVKPRVGRPSLKGKE